MMSRESILYPVEVFETRYPFLTFGTPASGTATCYLTNFIQMTRFTADGPSTAAAFANGTITSSTNSLGHGVDPGATFLDVWSSAATRENFYWRYTPTPYVIGTRTLGTVDFAADPGTDYGTTKVVAFTRPVGALSTPRSLTMRTPSHRVGWLLDFLPPTAGARASGGTSGR